MPSSSGTSVLQSASLGSGAGDVFQLLRDGSPRSRTELAETTGMARSTLRDRLDTLTALGLIGAAADGASTGGRPPRRVALLPTARLILAVDLGASHLRVAIADLTNHELARAEAALDITEGPDKVLKAVLGHADLLLQEVGRDRDAVLAIGLGVPGPVHFDTGRPSRPPIMPGWDGFDIPGWFRAHLDAAVLVDNDVNLMALGEYDCLETPAEHFLFVKIATGIGAGIISGGLLQRGAQGTAGDIGHVRIRRGDGVYCHCGNEGCLEALAAGPPLAAALREQGIEAESGGDVVRLVEAGNVEAIQAVRQAGRDLGEVLAASISFLNPSVIAVGGRMAAAGEHLLAGVREVVYQRGMPLATQHLQIRPSLTREHAGLRGAGLLATHHALQPAAIEEMARRLDGEPAAS